MASEQEIYGEQKSRAEERMMFDRLNEELAELAKAAQQLQTKLKENQLAVSSLKKPGREHDKVWLLCGDLFIKSSRQRAQSVVSEAEDQYTEALHDVENQQQQLMATWEAYQQGL